MSPIALASCASSSLPSATSNSSSARTASRSSTRLTFSELEPALRARTRNRQRRRCCGGHRGFPSWLVGPGPIAYLRQVLTVVAGVPPGSQPAVDHLLAKPCRLRAQRRHAVDHVHHEVEAIEVVEHHHVERRRGRA